MATATARKTTAAAAENALPVTFDEINRRKVRERIEGYRSIVHRQATGGKMTAEDMEQAAELLEHLGLPLYTFERDVEALRRAETANAKLKAASDAAPANQARAAAIAAEIETMQTKLAAMREEHRRAIASHNKPAAYNQTLAQLASEHPHVLADIGTAVELRLESLDRRKQIGGAA